VTNTATDSDSPPNTLTYTLLTAPAGATISSSGVITWTPGETQGPGTNVITTRVTDNGIPQLSATNSFTVVVTEVNTAPTLPAQNNRTISATATLVVTNTGSDSDIPANTLSYSLLVAPVGATISPAGVITWTPTLAQAPSTNTITTVVTDSSSPPLSATNSFLVIVTQSNPPPVITSQPLSRTNNAGTTATFSVAATGSSLTYQWIKNSSINLADAGNISGATTPDLTISNVSSSDAGTYTVQITNSAGSVLSAPATLTVISTNVGAQLFADDFSRGSDPGPLTPWIAQSGTWTVTAGVLKGGTNAAQTSTFAYVTNTWTNYSVQARVRFSAINGDGGGIGGRVNPVTGAHYAAWIFPEGSVDGPAIMRIFKFQDWFSFEYTNVTYQPLALVNLPSVGTNWHTLKLTFQGNQIGAYYDGVQVAAVTDTESNPYATGAISVDMFTDNNIYNMFVDDVMVNALPPILMAVNDLYFVNRGGNLTVPAPGILANDTTPLQTNLTAARLTGPFRGTLTFNSNGGFTYVPTNNITGIDTFTYVANDGTGSSAPAVVTINVTPPTNSFFDDFTRATPANSFSPWVIGLGEWSVTNGTLQGMATIANDYSDAYIPRNWTNFTIQARITLPSGAWAGGLSARVNPATGARYVANIYPEGSPLGPTPALRLIKFHTWNTWSDTFTPMALVNLPNVGTSPHTLRLTVQGNQIIVYFDNNQVVNMVDNNVDGLPAYSSGAAGAHMYMDAPFVATFDDLSITQINLTNTPPVLPAQVNRTMAALTTLLVTNTATDSDIPTQVLTYQLVSPPLGAAISPSGLISWTPNAGQAPSTNLITTIVTDNGTPAMSATNSFTVVVTPASTNAPGQLFTDDFTRGTDPAPITPWIAQAGTWTVTGGSMRAGINTLQTYANAYLTNVWTNFAVQAQIRFPSGGFGGGIGSRVNRNTGAHYGAWIYPEGSPGGSTMLKLVKFQTWTSWSYNGASFTPMQQVSLPSVGTNWHTLKLGCFGNQISVSYDGTVYINMTDAEAAPYLTGGVSADLWTDTVGYNMLVDNVVVTSLVNNSLNSIKPVIPLDSAPVIKSVVLKDGVAVITWTANPGSVYRLQFKDDFKSPKWLDAEPDIIATDTEASATNSIVGAPQRIYRVLVLP
jgi:Bacterial Ig domain/Immunoglobulin domain